MTEYGFLSVLPPVLALALAIFTRQVYVSLFAGIWLGHTILLGFQPIGALIGSVDALVEVFEDPGRTKIILLSALIGAFLSFTQYSGGMRGLVDWLTQRGFATTRRSDGHPRLGYRHRSLYRSECRRLCRGTRIEADF